ncbi:hypothetical protein ACWEPN_19465 [Nonomuraea wenchangensis]
MERGRGLRREYPKLAGELGRFLRRHPYEDLEALVAYLRAADAEGLRELVDGLWQEPGADPRRVREVIDHGERALRNGQAGAVRDGLRSAVERVVGALATIDDSSGIVGDDLAELMRLYARACADAPPPPQALAAWLVGMWLDGPGLPRVAVRDFAPALGPDGLDACGRLVDERRSGTRRVSPTAEREHERPADVVGPYRWLIDDCLADREQIRYNQVAELLIRLRAVQQGLDDEAGFAAYLGELRERHERRPALIARLADL